MITPELVLAQAPKLLGYARRLTRTLADAEDLWQETQMRAWQSRHTFQDKNLGGWLATIMHHAHATKSIRRKSVNTVSVSNYDSTPSELESHRETPDTLGIGDGLDKFCVGSAGPAFVDASHAFASLTPCEAELVRAVMMDGCSYEDLGERFGITTHAILQRLVRARAKMEKYL